jgi:hypothetical protein
MKPQEDVAEDFAPDSYCIRSCGPNGESYGGFRWPLAVGAIVTCPDWLPHPECGNGLHGLLDGLGDWSLIDDTPGRVWQVIGVSRSEVIEINDFKVKFPRGKVAYSGTAIGAMSFIQPHRIAAIQKAATTGDGSAERPLIWHLELGIWMRLSLREVPASRAGMIYPAPVL